MPTRDSAPIGSPCWADLWTSDVEGSRAFYAALFGWEAQEPSPEFGGYFMFTRDGVPVAGGMGPMGDMAADDTWKIYLATDDLDKTLQSAEAERAQISAPSMAVADLGTQAVLIDPGGAPLGVWQPGTFPGFTVIDEPGAPSWFELFTRDYAATVEFYRSVFRWETNVISATDEFRYTTMRDPDGDAELAGIMDAAPYPAVDFPVGWTIYWEVADVDASVAQVKALGGRVLSEPGDTPYGRIANVTDPAGARFKLRTAGH